MRNFIDENAIISLMQHIFLFLNARYTIAELKINFHFLIFNIYAENVSQSVVPCRLIHLCYINF